MSVEHVDHGLYLLNDGDTPMSVARRVYGGDVHKVKSLLDANPADWTEVYRVVVPGKKGRTAIVGEGESPHDLIRRMFPNQPMSIYLQPFFTWNGGQEMHLTPGELVYVPER